MAVTFQCVRCGQHTDSPVMVVYDDAGFEHKPQAAFPVDPACFDLAARYRVADEAELQRQREAM